MQSTYTGGVILLAFIIYTTMKGNLVKYLEVMGLAPDTTPATGGGGNAVGGGGGGGFLGDITSAIGAGADIAGSAAILAL